MRDALRTCLQIAGGLTEATRRRAAEAAREMLDQAGIDPAALQERIGAAIPQEVQTLADELVASGRANRDLLLGIVREEVDKAMSRVGRLADEVTKVGVVLEALERRIRNLEQPGADTGPDGAPGAGRTRAPAPTPTATAKERAQRTPPAAPPVEHVRVDTEPAPTSVANPRRTAAPGKPASAKPAPAKKAAPAAKKTAAKKTAAKKTAAKQAPAKQAAAKKTAAKKAPAKKTATTGTPAEETAARPTPAKQTAAKQTPAKKAPAKTTPAKQAAAKKTAAAKSTPARKAPAKRTPAAGSGGTGTPATPKGTGDE
ncbi:histone [Actinacidiphila sp. bgisy144]|uniref:histone n=1 Tax=Actinacidiphila sp. bgisy144 TaxID=3413791 RepID=UPI003EBC1C84